MVNHQVLEPVYKKRVKQVTRCLIKSNFLSIQNLISFVCKQKSTNSTVKK